GPVVFADDGTGFKGPVEDGVLEAARGKTVSVLTHLNTDANDVGPPGVAAVEVYEPQEGGVPPHRVGVLEVYLPYSPIQSDVADGLRGLYRALSAGLALLYIALLVISFSVSRRLRDQVRV